ncbi:hypothetical protein Z043_106747 [Scleropages formosus]|uniref:ELMO domain-containing protein n=1 Tax=Scleropages formosus TaxID=113540 RepID=A0A0N8K171_SCLFO|nr:hypothetical protein Z043_106747 [Scleropages formosus]
MVQTSTSCRCWDSSVSPECEQGSSERGHRAASSMPPPADIVKVAIEWPGAFPRLMEIDQKKPLSAIIKEVCEGWSLGNPENYALQNADSTNFYITEKNRNDIKNGSILRLTTSPAQTAQQLHERIQSSSMDAKLEALKDLASASRDITFAQEFINLDGISLLTQMVESGTERYQKLQKIMKPCFGDLLSFTLTAFVELMDHGIVSWDTFSVAFIKKIASYVNKSAMDTAVLQRSLAILESMVLNSQDLYQKVAQEITIGQLIPHLQGTDQDIQTYTIAVINALFLKAPEEKRQEMAHILAQKQLRSIILTVSVSENQHAVTRTLYVLQVLTFNLLEDRMMTKMDPQDQAQRDIIFELRRIAFDVECEPNNSGSIEKRKSMYTRDYKKLGFINHVNPAVDFTQIPPGMLALDNMLYLAKHHQDAYIRIVLENSSREDKHECPFGRSSIELTKMLCEILKVGELRKFPMFIAGESGHVPLGASTSGIITGTTAAFSTELGIPEGMLACGCSQLRLCRSGMILSLAAEMESPVSNASVAGVNRGTVGVSVSDGRRKTSPSECFVLHSIF